MKTKDLKPPSEQIKVGLPDEGQLNINFLMKALRAFLKAEEDLSNLDAQLDLDVNAAGYLQICAAQNSLAHAFLEVMRDRLEVIDDHEKVVS